MENNAKYHTMAHAIDRETGELYEIYGQNLVPDALYCLITEGELIELCSPCKRKKYRLKKGGFLWWLREGRFALTIIATCIILVAIAGIMQPSTTEDNFVAMASETEQQYALEYPLYDIPLEDKLQIYTENLCYQYDIDPTLVFAIMYAESRYDCYAVNGDCIGLMQISNEWHRERLEALGGSNLLDPYDNIMVGVDYLSQLMHLNKGLEWTLMTYNGTDEVDKRELLEQGETTEYVDTVLAKWEQLNNENR